MWKGGGLLQKQNRRGWQEEFGEGAIVVEQALDQFVAARKQSITREVVGKWYLLYRCISFDVKMLQPWSWKPSWRRQSRSFAVRTNTAIG